MSVTQWSSEDRNLYEPTLETIRYELQRFHAEIYFSDEGRL